ncbi:MAG TPA: glucokinase [Methylocystis sp.]|nr:glucokinase [Methylocystis sp.]
MGAEAIGLVADIGGTNARFALVSDRGVLGAARAYADAGFGSLADASARFLADEGGARPSRAVLAVAAPISGDRVEMTNLPAWSFSTRELQAALGLEDLRVVNDFAALAHAIPLLTGRDLRQIGAGASVAGAPAAILGPGSGLGVSALVPGPGGAVAVSGEGGHATMAAATPQEAAALAVLRARYAHVSAERVLSGSGLVNLYEAHCALAGGVAKGLSPADVARAGLEAKDESAQAALNMFCAMLGGFAGDLALIFGARGGVYIGGGVVPKLGEFFARSEFRIAFERKGRFSEYLAAIPTFVILHETPALLGAARLLARDAPS